LEKLAGVARWVSLPPGIDFDLRKLRRGREPYTVRVAVKNVMDEIFVEGSGYYSIGDQITASYSLEY